MLHSSTLRLKQSTATALFRSEENYFHLGANCVHFAGIDIIYMPEFMDLASGCVVLWKSTPRESTDAQNRVNQLEAKLGQLGASQCRIYDYSGTTVLGRVLDEKGYTGSREYVLSIPCGVHSRQGDLSLQPIHSQEDWSTKRELHQHDKHAPDGHSVLPERWIEMEYRKHKSGNLKFFFALWKGQLCGTVGAMYEGAFLRMKNLYVHPDWRKRGIGAAITQAMLRHALDSGYSTLGLLALAEGPALSMYKAQGARILSHQDEWITVL